LERNDDEGIEVGEEDVTKIEGRTIMKFLCLRNILTLNNY
jgi:hypothetical protein